MIHTERLVLRRWTADDLDPYAAICADPDVMRWIGGGAPRSRDQCATAISRFECAWEDDGFGLFAVASKASARLIGFVGFSVPEFLPELLPAVEIGWRLAADQWGKGLATEAAQAALAFGFERAGSARLDRIVSIHQVGNEASGRIMEKLGMRLERETVHPTHGRALRVFELTRRAWEGGILNHRPRFSNNITPPRDLPSSG